MLAWETILPKILQNLASLIPARIIHEGDIGVRITGGRYSDVSLEGGAVYWFLPWYQEIIIESDVLQTSQVADLSVTTKDDKSCCVGMVLGWRIKNLKAFETRLTEGEDDILNIAQTIVTEHIRKYTKQTLLTYPKEFHTEVKNDLSRKLQGKGAEILWLRLTNLASARHIRLLQ